MIRKIIIALAVTSAVATSAQAASLVVNGSFEMVPPTFDPAQKVYLAHSGTDTLYGWSVADGPVSIRSPELIPPSDGEWSIDLAGYIGQVPRGSISQTIATQAGQSYRLSFDMGDDPFNAPATPPRMRVTLGDVFTQDYEFDDSTFQTVPYAWKTFTVDFTAQSSSTLLSFAGLIPGSDNIGLDNVSVEALGVPEPSTWAMLLVGFAGVGAAVRGRRPHAREPGRESPSRA
jgi:hypothetical protein